MSGGEGATVACFIPFGICVAVEENQHSIWDISQHSPQKIHNIFFFRTFTDLTAYFIPVSFLEEKKPGPTSPPSGSEWFQFLFNSYNCEYTELDPLDSSITCENL